jgi:Family of unknown function (DUF6931)
MALFSRPVVPLPKLTTASAADLAAKANVHPASKALLKPGMTSSEYVHTLEQHKQSLDATKTLAHGMSERDSVWWASQSSRKVADKLNPQETTATQAAEAWVKNPSETTKAAAAKAAGKTDFKGPGGWAAQAAAWSQNSTASTVSTTVPSTPPLTAAAVTGAVLLASGLVNRPALPPPQKPDLLSQTASLPKEDTSSAAASATQAPVDPPPVDQAKLAKPLQQFIALGKDIASGKNSWA